MKKTAITIQGRKVVQQGNRLVVEIQTGRGKAFANVSREDFATDPFATTTTTCILGANRGKTKLWLEGNILSAHGWTTGAKFDV